MKSCAALNISATYPAKGSLVVQILYVCPFLAVKDFVSEWIKYQFGVFDEHGYVDDQLHPPFYSNTGEILPTSCTNAPIRGNFTKDCLTHPDSCPFQNGQTEITSSLLFDTNATIFPKVENIKKGKKLTFL